MKNADRNPSGHNDLISNVGVMEVPTDEVTPSVVSSETTTKRSEGPWTECLLSELKDKFSQLEDIYWEHQIYTESEFFDKVNSQTDYDQNDQREIRDLIDEIHPFWNYSIDVEN